MLNLPIGGDVSKWNGKALSWAKTGSKLDFMYIRLGSIDNASGNLYTDFLLEEHVEGCESVQLPYGFYFYMRPQWSGKKQAEFMLQHSARFHPDLPPVLDIEYRPPGLTLQQTTNQLVEFVRRILEEGFNPIIYTRQTFWDSNVLAHGMLANCRLWAARYKDMTGPWADGKCKFRDWDEWLLWQYSSKANFLAQEYGFPGYPLGTVDFDLNYLNGTLEDLMEDTVELPAEDVPIGKVVITGSQLNLRSAPLVSYATYAGAVRKGRTFFVFETKSTGGYLWCRIGRDVWVASGISLAVYMPY